MTVKPVDAILKPDARFADLCIVEHGRARHMSVVDHHAALARIGLAGAVPAEDRAAFDRARNTMIYAFFDYDLLMVFGEVQALGAFEFALKHRLNGQGGASRGTLRNLVDRARKAGTLPFAPDANALCDPIEALIALRNGLSHGTADIHSPGMALEIAEACAFWIDHIYPPGP